MKTKIIASLLIVFLTACNSIDNKVNEARKYVESITFVDNQNSNIKLVDFKKVNGEEFIRNGYTMYKITYLATFEALENGTIYSLEDNNTAYIAKLYTGHEVTPGGDYDSNGDYTFSDIAPFKKEIKIHETFFNKGDVIMLKTDNGWEAKSEYQ